MKKNDQYKPLFSILMFMQRGKALIMKGTLLVASVSVAAGMYAGMPKVATASPIVRSGDSVSVNANQVLDTDFYGLGGTVTLSGPAKKNVYVAGGTITTDGDIASGLTALGGIIQVHGAVKDSVRAVGGEVTIAKPITGDVVVMSGTLTILSTGSVSGDILFLGGTLDVEGTVQGSIVGATAEARINAPVGGNIDLRASRSLFLGDAANISGNIQYTSTSDLVRAQNATVKGTISKETIASTPLSALYRDALFKLLIIVFAALTLFLLIRTPLERLVAETRIAFGKQLLVGFLLSIGVPFLSVLLIASLLGAIVGIALFIGYIFLSLIAVSASGVVLGAFLYRLLRQEPRVTLVSAVIGTMVFGLLVFVPIIGPLAIAAIFLSVFGGIALSIYHFFK